MSDNVVASTDTGSSPREYNAANGPKAIIKNVDMTEEMQQESVDIATAALEKYNIEKDIAAQIKKEFDRRHGATWHVVVGKNFGSYVTHETKHFIYFYVGSLAILIWKS
ncbi:hypothetical protein AZE42_05814 [Rhizopogon vesiculosus]|uniref:Dynein light chain n=2 Tax=Rhizopogon TaxID=5375 RepID=A0A1J8R9L5_9AGAM|nr:hypothetical protein AZE42_05814 [Rhizopogon vesiculosus]